MGHSAQSLTSNGTVGTRCSQLGNARFVAALPANSSFTQTVAEFMLAAALTSAAAAAAAAADNTALAAVSLEAFALAFAPAAVPPGQEPSAVAECAQRAHSAELVALALTRTV
jgi:hypothetical protein